jgi:hypothetical protein
LAKFRLEIFACMGYLALHGVIEFSLFFGCEFCEASARRANALNVVIELARA